MKGAIIFASRTGTSKKVAEEIQKNLKIKLDLINLKFNLGIDIKKYDLLIFGTYMRRQKADIDIVDLLRRNKDTISKKKAFFFVLAAETGEGYTREIRDSFPAEILESSQIYNLGASIDSKQLNFADKIMLRQIAQKQRKTIQELHTLDNEKIKNFVELINQEIEEMGNTN